MEVKCLLRKPDVLLIRIRTDQGLVRYAPDPASENTLRLINRNLKLPVINIDPAKTEGLRKKIFEPCPLYPGVFEAYDPSK